MQIKPRHLPAEQRRAVTVEAVVELASRQNPGDITTAAIAEKMHLTQGALFRHFPTKSAIWQAVMEWVADRLLAKVDQAIQSARSPHMVLEDVFMAHVEFVVSHPGVPRMVVGELQRAEHTPAKGIVRELFGRYSERLVELIEAGKTRGELAPEVDAAAAATMFIGTIQGLVLQSLLVGDVRHMRKNAQGAFAIYSRGIRSVR